MGSPCPANLTQTSFSAGAALPANPAVAGSEFEIIRVSINAEFTRRSLATSSWSSPGATADASIYNEMRNEISNKLGTSTPASGTLGTTVAAGQLMKATGTSPASPQDLVDRLDEWKVACICDCNYCTCDCNYCTCDCNYCTCDCNYCTCNCNYCTCNCNYCTCNCAYCTCNCNYCTCDCAYCTCDCAYCTCNCAYCTCNCNYCTCNCNAGK